MLAGHMDGITYIDPRGDGRYLITNSKDQTIKLWDMRAFSDHNGELNTRKAVANQTWDYRWQRVPKRREWLSNNEHYFLVYVLFGNSCMYRSFFLLQSTKRGTC